MHEELNRKNAENQLKDAQLQQFVAVSQVQVPQIQQCQADKKKLGVVLSQT